MSSGRSVAVFLALSLMANAFCAPSSQYRRRRDFDDNQIDSKDSKTKPDPEPEQKDITTFSSTTSSTTEDKSDEDDDDFDEEFNSPPSTGGGSNIFTLLNLANALFQTSSTSSKNGQSDYQSKIRDRISRNKTQFAHRRQDLSINEIDINYETNLKPPTAEPKPTFQRQESKESESETSESESSSEEDNVAKESIEKESHENASDGDSGAEQVSTSNESENDSDYDEPEGDGQGGGLLGLLGGLSGGDGESDIATLLATVGGIVANLSGGGVDINAVIATAIGLFVGLLSDGEQNPGEIIARYLQTSLETITGGGAQNNGKFFGTFVSKLIKGISADRVPEDSNEDYMPMADSGGFLFSLLMGLLGDMSKSSFDGSSKPWR